MRVWGLGLAHPRSEFFFHLYTSSREVDSPRLSSAVHDIRYAYITCANCTYGFMMIMLIMMTMTHMIIMTINIKIKSNNNQKYG